MKEDSSWLHGYLRGARPTEVQGVSREEQGAHYLRRRGCCPPTWTLSHLPRVPLLRRALSLGKDTAESRACRRNSLEEQTDVHSERKRTAHPTLLSAATTTSRAATQNAGLPCSERRDRQWTCVRDSWEQRCSTCTTDVLTINISCLRLLSMLNNLFTI